MKDTHGKSSEKLFPKHFVFYMPQWKTAAISIKIHDKRDDFVFLQSKFSFFDGGFPVLPLLKWVYISELIRFTSVSSHVTNFNFNC